jgi:rare lipoprotein A
MKKILTILLCGAIIAAVAGAEVWMQNFRQRGSASRGLSVEGMAAAHPSLPLRTRVQVVNLQNQKEVVVTVVGRIAASGNRIIDLSREAADALGLDAKGVTAVSIETIRERRQ